MVVTMAMIALVSAEMATGAAHVRTPVPGVASSWSMEAASASTMEFQSATRSDRGPAAMVGGLGVRGCAWYEDRNRFAAQLEIR